MSKAERAGDLEIDEDLSFQRREWRVQRGGWVVMAVLILLALLGLTGRGPIRQPTAGTATIHSGSTMHASPGSRPRPRSASTPDPRRLRTGNLNFG